LLWLGILLLAGCEDSSTGPELEIFIEGPLEGGLLVGDQVQLGAVLSNPSATGTVSWSSSDTAVVLVDQLGNLRAQRPGSATVSVELNKAMATALVTVAPRPGGYTADEIDYLQEIAFGFEYGTASEVIRKWAENPRIQLFGVPTVEDMAVLEGVVGELNGLMEEVQVELVESDPTVEVHFAPVSDFPSILPSYVPGNLGYFYVSFDGFGNINRSVVLLASEGVDQEGRSHLIREEITQILGLSKDSGTYPNSIFYSTWTTTQHFDPIDEVLVEMLYRPQLLPGMAYRPAVDVLRTLVRRGGEVDAALFHGQRGPGIRSTSVQEDSTRPPGPGGVGSGGD